MEGSSYWISAGCMEGLEMNSYKELVKRVNDNWKKTKVYNDQFTSADIELTEINPWTYWQGRDVRHPRIILLGQDWGSKEIVSEYPCFTKNIKSEDNKVDYFDNTIQQRVGRRIFTSDENLTIFFEQLGYSTIRDIRYSDLFFTNLIPGFRREAKSTGGFRTCWITEQVKVDFRDLINILNPQMVLCLGKDTFVQAAKIWEVQNVLQGKSWKDYLNGNPSPIKINKEKGTFYLFALPHPGYYGIINRDLNKQKEDWNRVKQWMQSNPWCNGEI